MDKQKYQIELRSKLFDLDRFLRSRQAALDTWRSEVKKLHERSGDFSQEYILKEENRITGEYKANCTAAVEKCGELIDAVISVMRERQAEPLSLDNPQLSLALQVIQMSGDRLPDGELQKIVDQFTACPQELAVLGATFKNGGISSGVKKVQDKTYSLDYFKQGLGAMIYEAILYNSATLDNLAREINKVMAKDGVPFPLDGKPINPNSFEEAVRRAAGVPAKDF